MQLNKQCVAFQPAYKVFLVFNRTQTAIGTNTSNQIVFVERIML